ncbi:unnamed protein product, partial [Bubo scandiacus]
ILDYNPIAKISKQFFTRLQSSVLGSMINNSLEMLPKNISTLINWMDSEGNHIKALTNTTFLECDALTVLFLHGNQVCLLPANTFSSLKDLGELDLSSNMITELPCYLFKDMNHRITEFNLSFNPLSHLSEDHIKSLQQLQYLEMTEILNINGRTFQHTRDLSYMYVYVYELCALFIVNELCNLPNSKKDTKVCLMNRVPKVSADFIDCKYSQCTTGSDLQF